MSTPASEAEIVARGHANLEVWDQGAGAVTVRVWSNQGAGPSGPDALPVVACAGLGTPPEAWPLLMAQPERYRVLGAYYRGTSGSPRPDGPYPTVEDHVADVIALMDAEGMERALFLGWSMGVNIACEAAVRHPDRVAGILGVAGVPGDTFASLLGPLPVPRRLRRPIGMIGSRAASAIGPGISALASRLPVHQTTWVFRHMGMAMPVASQTYLEPLLATFLQHDFGWYFKLALGSGAHRRMDLAAIKQPVTLIAGRWDILTSAVHIAECAAEIPDCRFELLSASHFLPAEYAPECERALLELAERAGLTPLAA